MGFICVGVCTSVSLCVTIAVVSSTGCDSTSCDSTGCDSTGCDSTCCESTGCDSTCYDSTGCDSTCCEYTGCDSTGCVCVEIGIVSIDVVVVLTVTCDSLISDCLLGGFTCRNIRFHFFLKVLKSSCILEILVFVTAARMK